MDIDREIHKPDDSSLNVLNVFVEMLHVHRILKINLQFIHQPILAFAKNSFMHLADPEGI